MEYERSERALAIRSADLRGGTAGGIYRRERITKKMGREKSKQSQARRDSSSDLRGSLHGNQGDTSAATDPTADSQARTETVHGPIWSSVSSEPAVTVPIESYTQTPEPKDDPFVVVSYLEVPLLQNIFDGYYSERVDCRLDSNQKKTLRYLQFGLQARYAKLKNGKEVANGQDAIKWLLENL